MRQPTFYLPHGGGPCFFLNRDGSVPSEWRRMHDFLSGVLSELPERPRAILIVSGHWLQPDFTVHDGERPELLFDYYGFPAHTYQLRWDAPGAPGVAKRAARLLKAAGFATRRESARGWDHGVFIPLKVAVPEADIPVVQVSLRSDLDPAAHIGAGQALAPLRDEGVLIVGSGMSFHNMRLRDGSAEVAAEAFDAGLTAAVTDPDPVQRLARLAAWEDIPAARIAHPPGEEEHLLPLMVAAGAGGADPAHHIFRDRVIGWTISAFRFG